MSFLGDAIVVGFGNLVDQTVRTQEAKQAADTGSGSTFGGRINICSRMKFDTQVTITNSLDEILALQKQFEHPAIGGADGLEWAIATPVLNQTTADGIKQAMGRVCSPTTARASK